MTSTTPEDAVAFPVLSDDQIAVVETFGERRATRTGDILYRQGDPTYDFYVVLSGEVDVTIATDGHEESFIRCGPGQFLGELSLLTGLRTMVTTRVTKGGEVLVVTKEQFRSLIATQPGLSDTILVAYITRRSRLLSGAAATTRVIGSRFSKETLRIREFLARLSIPHEWLDPDRHEDVDEVLVNFGLEVEDLPVVIVSGTVLRRPSTGRLSEYLGLTLQSLPERCFDLIVVGGGPAGLAASVYGASEGLSTLAVERFGVGGQAGTSSRIENYLGFPTGISGSELAQRAVVQAEKFGARMTAPCEAESLRQDNGYLIVRLSDGSDVIGRAVVAASGARYRRLPADRLEDFEDAGVYYAATHLEARICTPAPVVVVGGGNSAGQAAMFLADSGSPVTIVIRSSDLGASMSRYLVDRIDAHPNIRVRTQCQVTALDGDETLATVRLSEPDQEETIPCVGLFSFIGADPTSGWISSCAALDDHGFILTDRMLPAEDLPETWQALGRAPLPYETNRPGFFAAGDVRSGSVKRVAAAVGEGSACVSSVHSYLAFGEGVATRITTRLIDRSAGSKLNPLEYPFERPSESFVWNRGKVQTVAQDADLEDLLSGRSPILAIGSNASPEQLGRKFAAGGFQIAGSPDSFVPVLRASVPGIDVVYAASVAGYGSIPATPMKNVGAVADVFVTWLTPLQRQTMDESEGLGQVYRLRAVDGVVYHGHTADNLPCYASTRGVAIVGGSPIGLAAIRVGASTNPRMHQREAWQAVASSMGLDMSGPKLLEMALHDGSVMESVRTHLVRHAADDGCPPFADISSEPQPPT